MSLIKWQPLEELHSLRQQINRIFDDVVHEESGLGLFPKMRETPWMPAIELQETEAELILKAQVPGLEPENLDIQVSDNAIFLTGEYQEQKKDDSRGIMRSEFHYGRFTRVVPLPSAIQHDHVMANMTDGLLTLTMPKAVPSVPSMVKVPLTKSAPETAVAPVAQ
jgi:HSP20 family protein